MLNAGEGEFAGADPEDKDEYTAYNVFFVPEFARWNYLISKAKLPEIGKLVDDAMELIEAGNPQLKVCCRKSMLARTSTPLYLVN